MTADPNIDMKWALVCSVPKQSLVDELTEFTEWFLKEVSNVSHSIGLSYSFEEHPTVVRYVVPGDMAGCVSAYSKMHEEHPCVHLVVHILPKSSSDEYEWMKKLSSELGVIRQGVLLDNALSRFGDCDDTSTIFKNERTFDIRVGDGQPISCKTFNPKNIQTATNNSLHGSDITVCRDESAVKIEGFPLRLNEFGVAQLFGELGITSVTLRGSSATVIFTNKFHALQAMELNNKVLDRRHTLKLVSLDREVNEQLQLAA